MNAETILARLQGVRRPGDGWTAKCPAHEDRSPSLSVSEHNGKILLHCFAGCTTKSVCAALGMEMRELFIAPRVFREAKPPIVREAEKRIAGLRSHLTPTERERPVTVVLATCDNLDAAMARALALAVEGELVQVAVKEGEQ